MNYNEALSESKRLEQADWPVQDQFVFVSGKDGRPPQYLVGLDLRRDPTVPQRVEIYTNDPNKRAPTTIVPATLVDLAIGLVR